MPPKIVHARGFRMGKGKKVKLYIYCCELLQVVNSFLSISVYPFSLWFMCSHVSLPRDPAVGNLPNDARQPGNHKLITERRSQQTPLQPPNRHKVTYAPLEELRNTPTLRELRAVGTPCSSGQCALLERKTYRF